MITFKFSTQVNADRQIVQTLPPEVPTGNTDLVVTVMVNEAPASEPKAASGSTLTRNLTPSEMRKLPREQRQPIFAEAAALAEEVYRSDPDLRGFDAFSEELDDDELIAT
jgi:hypothetical protein